MRLPKKDQELLAEAYNGILENIVSTPATGGYTDDDLQHNRDELKSRTAIQLTFNNVKKIFQNNKFEIDKVVPEKIFYISVYSHEHPHSPPNKLYFREDIKAVYVEQLQPRQFKLTVIRKSPSSNQEFKDEHIIYSMGSLYKVIDILKKQTRGKVKKTFFTQKPKDATPSSKLTP